MLCVESKRLSLAVRPWASSVCTALEFLADMVLVNLWQPGNDRLDVISFNEISSFDLRWCSNLLRSPRNLWLLCHRQPGQPLVCPLHGYRTGTSPITVQVAVRIDQVPTLIATVLNDAPTWVLRLPQNRSPVPDNVISFFHLFIGPSHCWLCSFYCLNWSSFLHCLSWGSLYPGYFCATPWCDAATV